MPKLASWVADYNRWGLRRTAYKRLMLAVRARLVFCGVYVRPLVEGPAPPPPEGIEVRVARRSELLAAAEAGGMELSVEFVRSALARGDICVAAFRDGRMIAQVWRSLTCAPHVEGLWVRFRRPYRYGYKAYTHPEFRGCHLQVPVSRFLDDYFIARGFTHNIGFIETHNYASIASEERRGGRRAGWAGYFRMFGRALPFRSREARERGFGFVAKG